MKPFDQFCICCRKLFLRKQQPVGCITACFIFLSVFLFVSANAQNFVPGAIWPDDKGEHINAHGGGVLHVKGVYYWFGEHKSEKTSAALKGITCYSSNDLLHWKNEGIALPVMPENSGSDLESGCVMERPKVVYNKKTNKYVMWFHLELKGRGYEAARVGVAVSDKPAGPYKFIHSYRPCSGHWPDNLSEEGRTSAVKPADFEQWWTPEWRKAVREGLFVRRDKEGGQMSRDMTIFVDDDKKAYHIYSSEENLTLHIAELSADYQSHTGTYSRLFPGGLNEAPAIFKKEGTYFMITSGCTGWAPNEARLFSAPSVLGPWKQHPNPCQGVDAALTFHGQSTYILPVAGKKDAFIFMADRWTPDHPSDARYIWLPILFENGLPVLKWMDQWDLSIFDKTARSTENAGWKLVWNDEFNYTGKPDSSCWSYENTFVRNEEYQWYQPDNAHCENGVLVLEARKEQVKNPSYKAGSKSWYTNRPFAEYTSSSIKTSEKKEFLYGRFEVRARIPVAGGAWPAIWFLGRDMEWPSCGEIDLMEYYRIQGVPHILANAAWGTDKRYDAKWNTKRIPFTHFTEKDPNWAQAFHIWRMDWDKDFIRMYLDDELLNEIPLSETDNGTVGEGKNPFRQPHYLLLNLAIGGINGGEPDVKAFPMNYEIDYVRVYQPKN